MCQCLNISRIEVEGEKVFSWLLGIVSWVVISLGEKTMHGCVWWPFREFHVSGHSAGDCGHRPRPQEVSTLLPPLRNDKGRLLINLPSHPRCLSTFLLACLQTHLRTWGGLRSFKLFSFALSSVRRSQSFCHCCPASDEVLGTLNWHCLIA